MALEWDVLLNDVSIRDKIATFSIRQEKGGHAKEVTLFAADKDFFDSFTYTSTPELSIEVKTKLSDTWVTQGKFYIEKPVYSLLPNQKISRGVWGRSETAKAGEPFANKVTDTWTENTTIQGIIQEMVALADLSVIFEIEDYPIYANTYSVDLKYPIEVISELCGFAGAFISCDAAGNLIIKKNLFHPGVSDFTVTDNIIRELSESIDYPEFGNRIKVSAFSSNTGYSIELESLGESDCLPADGVSELTLLAFVSLDGVPAEDNILVSWETEPGVTLVDTQSPTRSFLISKQVHNATNYNTVSVDYPILDVIGIWAYSDLKRTTNFWNSDLLGCTFDGKEITTNDAFEYCDQTLVISYLTTGVAINTAVAGTSALNPTVTASLQGAEGDLDLVVGNICSCGSQIDVRKIPDSEICIENKGIILATVEIGNGPAVGMIASFELDGCGSLSSTKKTLGDLSVLNEKTFTYNVIAGTTQIGTEIYISDDTSPAVYLLTDTNKEDNLYLSHSGKIIDLNTVLDNGVEVYIDYIASGAAAVTWLTRDLDEEDDGCDATVIIKVADGSEAGLEDSVTYTAQDCKTQADSSTYDDATSSSYSSPDDPDDVDEDTEDGGLDDCEFSCGDLEPGAAKDTCIENCQSGAVLTPCDVTMLNVWANVDNATPENKDAVRFGLPTDADCPENDEYDCDCNEFCEREMVNKGNTFEYDATVHDQALEFGDEGSPEYNEAYSTLRSDHITECEQNCEDTRNQVCGCSIIAGPDVMTPGEIAEFTCSDGASLLYTMPQDACGTITVTVGCCEKEVRSTDGYWEYDAGASWSLIYGCNDDGSGNYCFPYSLNNGICHYDIEEGSKRYLGTIATWYGTACGGCLPACRAGACIPGAYQTACGTDPICGVNNDNCSLLPRAESVYNWVCNP